MEKLYFTGHESFHCRNFWLKKGVDFIQEGHEFSAKEAVAQLGVGKNMVSSIRFWLKAFNLTDEKDSLNADLVERIFDTHEGWDPYLEDIGTIWLLHHHLVTHKRSSIYSLVFNEFRKKRIEFKKSHLIQFLEQYCKLRDIYYHQSSIKRDVDVFLNNYYRPAKSKYGIEDNFNGLLFELDLVQEIERMDEREKWYKLQNSDRPSLPHEVILHCILNKLGKGSYSISFNELLNGVDGVGSVFALTATGLKNKIDQIVEAHPQNVIFTEDGGVKVLQFKRKPNRWKVLKSYYAK